MQHLASVLRGHTPGDAGERQVLAETVVLVASLASSVLRSATTTMFCRASHHRYSLVLSGSHSRMVVNTTPPVARLGNSHKRLLPQVSIVAIGTLLGRGGFIKFGSPYNIPTTMP